MKRGYKDLNHLKQRDPKLYQILLDSGQLEEESHSPDPEPQPKSGPGRQQAQERNSYGEPSLPDHPSAYDLDRYVTWMFGGNPDDIKPIDESHTTPIEKSENKEQSVERKPIDPADVLGGTIAIIAIIALLWWPFTVLTNSEHMNAETYWTALFPPTILVFAGFGIPGVIDFIFGKFSNN